MNVYFLLWSEKKPTTQIPEEVIQEQITTVPKHKKIDQELDESQIEKLKLLENESTYVGPTAEEQTTIPEHYTGILVKLMLWFKKKYLIWNRFFWLLHPICL